MGRGQRNGAAAQGLTESGRKVDPLATGRQEDAAGGSTFAVFSLIKLAVTIGKTPKQAEIMNVGRVFCRARLPAESIYAFLNRECHRLFPDEMFADLFKNVGRRSVPPMILAVVMVLQRLLGLSDREAVDRFTFDLRWKYAAGGVSLDYPSFVHTVLVDMRARLRDSKNPARIFHVVLEVAKQAGFVGRKRALDSTPIYDAVATQDTVTMIRAAIRGLLRVAGLELEEVVRRVLKRDDDYQSPGKPACAWDDAVAREALVNDLVTDAKAALNAVEGRSLSPAQQEAFMLLATVIGQDIEQGEDGIFRIARRVAPDRVISTVDTETRHGHKTASRSFDGYKGHIAIDPDSEIITKTAVTAGNAGDASAAMDLLRDDLPASGDSASPAPPRDAVADSLDVSSSQASNESSPPTLSGPADDDRELSIDFEREPTDDDNPGIKPANIAEHESTDELVGDDSPDFEPTNDGDSDRGPPDDRPKHDQPAAPLAVQSDASVSNEAKLTVYGDAAYGAAVLLEELEAADVQLRLKVAAPTAGKGLFTKSDFEIDLELQTVRCPNDVLIQIRPRRGGGGMAKFGSACEGCPLKTSCTSSKTGRLVTIHPTEKLLAAERKRQQAADWQQDYKGTRPKVERKIAHLMRRRHGGRKARVRGQTRVDQDFSLLAAAVNLARIAILSAFSTGSAGNAALA